MIKRVIFIAIGVLFIAGCSRVDNKEIYSRTELIMGTFVEVKIVAQEESPEEVIRGVDEAFSLARRLEKMASIFYPESQLNKLNVSRELEVDPELYALIKTAKDMSRLTGGEFDVTVTPILKADGFYRDMSEEVLGKIPDTLEGVGWENIELSDDNITVTLHKGAWIDLSGIAKGYIVDRMAQLFRDKGLDFFLINAGGEISCGRKPLDASWRIGVRRPAEQEVVLTLGLTDISVATSGDYENVEDDKITGEVVSHIIDPLTEKPIKEMPSSVTVITTSCTRADALATGMMAMGPEKAIELAEDLDDVEIITVNKVGGIEIIAYSSGADKFFLKR